MNTCYYMCILAHKALAASVITWFTMRGCSGSSWSLVLRIWRESAPTWYVGAHRAQPHASSVCWASPAPSTTVVPTDLKESMSACTWSSPQPDPEELCAFTDMHGSLRLLLSFQVSTTGILHRMYMTTVSMCVYMRVISVYLSALYRWKMQDSSVQGGALKQRRSCTHSAWPTRGWERFSPHVSTMVFLNWQPV